MTEQINYEVTSNVSFDLIQPENETTEIGPYFGISDERMNELRDMTAQTLGKLIASETKADLTTVLSGVSKQCKTPQELALCSFNVGMMLEKMKSRPDPLDSLLAMLSAAKPKSDA